MLRIATAITLPLALATMTVAQAANANDLLSDDWRVRNATAVELIKHPDTKNQHLLRVLNTEWKGHVPSRGFGGAGGEFIIDEPRATTTRSARREIGYNWPIRALRHPKTIDEVVGPWHPHKLATLLLLARGTSDGLQKLKPTDINRARIWLRCCKPSAIQIETALANETTCEAVLFAYLPQVEKRNERRLEFIANGPAPARRAAIRMAGGLALGEPQLRGVIEQLLNDKDEAYTRNAAHHLVRSGAPAAKLLATHLGKDRRERQRVLALLCMMGEHARPAAAELLAMLEHDVTSQRRTLVAISNFSLPEELQQQAATKILALLETTRSRVVRVLAADALASCGHGVTEQQRVHLQSLLQERKYRSSHSRLLATLRKLNAVPELDLETVTKLATSIHYVDESLLVLADRGAEVGPWIVSAGFYTSAVAGRLLETAPDLAMQWLKTGKPGLQTTALKALLAKRPDLVTTKQLVSRLDKQAGLAAVAFGALCQRPDASQHTAAILDYASKQSWLSKQRVADIRRLQPSFPVLVETFEDSLRAGDNWSVVRGLHDQKTRELIRKWLKETDDDKVRDELLGELIKLGLTKGHDILMVEQVLRSGECDDVLDALSSSDKVPAQLIPALEEVCNIKPPSEWWTADWHARESLLIANR